MQMTPRELWLFAKGRNRQAKAAYEQEVQLLHLHARLMRAKKIPPLEQLIPPDVFKMSPEEVRERLWNKIRSIARKGEISYGKGKKK